MLASIGTDSFGKAKLNIPALAGPEVKGFASADVKNTIVVPRIPCGLRVRPQGPLRSKRLDPFDSVVVLVGKGDQHR